MKPSELITFIVERFKAGVKRPIYIEGAPGGGKTYVAKAAAQLVGGGFKMIHGPLLQPEDYGFPVISASRTDVDFVVPSEKFPLVGTDCPETGILLIDDMPQSGVAEQKIFGNLMQEREIHGKALKPGWLVIATGNRATDRAGANRLLTHLKNKITTVSFDVSMDDWCQWALANSVKPEIIAFIRFRPELLNAFDAQNEINATPRAWVDGVSASLGVVSKHLEFEAFRGDVGEGAAGEFLAWLKMARELPSPDAIMLDPAKADIPKAPAMLYAVCGAMAHRATPDNFGRIMQYITRLPAEFSVLFVRDAIRLKPDIQTSMDFIKWASTDGAKLLS